MDVGLLQEGTLSLTAARCLMAIRGLSKENIYCVGTDGEIFHFDGSRWQSIKSGTDEDLLCIKIVNADRVLIGGSNGTLLMGNHKDGFKDLSTLKDNMRIGSIEFFEGKIWIASNLGLFTYAEKASKLIAETTTLIPDLSDVGTLEAADGTLWSFGNKEIACFDGKKWNRIDHPDNPPIR
jgi:ligand-binding sensor domain-containing protein